MSCLTEHEETSGTEWRVMGHVVRTKEVEILTCKGWNI